MPKQQQQHTVSQATRGTRATTTTTTTTPENYPATSHEWTASDDRLLRELIAFRVPWRRIAVTLGHRTMDDVQTRWRLIRGPPPPLPLSPPHAGNGQTGTMDDTSTMAVVAEPQRRVSFTDPLVTGEDTDSYNDDDNSGDHTPTKQIFYIDQDFSLEDMVLLHNIAAKWERDRWLAISTRFNDLTQRAITPEQARSAVEGKHPKHS